MQDNLYIPKLEVLATRIGRQTRFAGATGDYCWSVLHHSFLVEAIVSDILADKPQPYREAVQLHALLHDLHEGVTNDIPTPFKDEETREAQAVIDRVIYSRLGIRMPGPGYRGIIHAADKRAMYAEIVVLKDRNLQDDFRETAYQNTCRADQENVEWLLDLYGSWYLTTSPDSRGVRDYVNAVRGGIHNCKRMHVANAA